MWLILLAACGGPAADFRDARAAAICGWHARCDTLAVAGFETRDACEEAYLDAADALRRDGQADCPGFDDAAAAACLAVWEEAACGEILDLSACDGVCDG